jgi:CRISPR-associated Csh1 family protein
MLRSIQKLGFQHVGNEIFSIELFDQYRQENPRQILKLFSEYLPKNTTVYIISSDNRIILTEYDSRNYQKYLFISSGKTGIGYYESLSFKHTGNPKRMLTRIENTFNKLLTSEHTEKLKDLVKSPLSTHKGKLMFSDFAKSVKREKGKTILYTFQIDGQFPAEFLTDEQCLTLLEWRIQEFYKHKGEELKGTSCCAVCSRELEVYGAAHPFNFCTVEKEGFFPGFDNQSAWRSFPVCPGDAILLNYGKKYIEQYLHDRLAGYNTIFIPVLVGNYSQREHRRLLKWFKDLVETDEIEDKGIKEESILRRLGKEGLPTQIVSYHFIMRKPGGQQTQFEIARHIVDVLPSRISAIARTIDEINTEFEKTSWRPEPFSLNFNFLAHIFGFPGKESALGALTVLDILESVFVKEQLSREALYRSFIRRLQENFKNPSLKIKAKNDTDRKRVALFSDISNILKLIPFLQKLEVIRMPDGEFTKFESQDANLAAWINEAGASLGKSENRCCFLIGRLFGVVWRYQMKERGSAPISKNLRSLNLTFKDIQQLFVELVVKLNEYGELRKHTYLTSDISKQISLSRNDGSISNDEAILWFVVGWMAFIDIQ